MTGAVEKTTLESKEYRRVESVFLDTVEDLGFTKFPVDPFRLARLLNVELVRYSNLFKRGDDKIIKDYRDGFSLLAGNKYRIIYNEFMPEPRMRFTLWYEMGHISLGHFDGTSSTTDEKRQQAECNHFARFALAPMPFVIIAAPEEPGDIMRVFGVSLSCARYVWKNYCAVMRHPKMAQRITNSRIARLLDFDVDEYKGGFDAI